MISKDSADAQTTECLAALGTGCSIMIGLTTATKLPPLPIMSFTRAQSVLLGLRRSTSQLRYLTVTSSRTALRSDAHAEAPSERGESMPLPDGRQLGFHQFGDPNGIPIVYIHGTPDSGASLCGLTDRLGRQLGVRWIGPDRPGIGLSSAQPNRRVLDYPADVDHLMRHLGLKQYYIVGISGGAGHTMACAKVLQNDQLKGIGVCAGMGPWAGGLTGQSLKIKSQMYLFKTFPRLVALAMKQYVALAQDPDPSKMEEAWRKALPSVAHTERDRMALLEPDEIRSAVAAFRQVYRNGVEAHVQDFLLNTRSWGFTMADVEREGIRFWYGSEDVNTPPEMGLYMAERLKRSVHKEYEGESHFTIWNERIVADIVKDLTESH